MKSTHKGFLDRPARSAAAIDPSKDLPDPHNPYGTKEELDDIFHQISHVTRSLRFATLLPGETQLLGGILFPEAPAMVRSIALALIEHPGEFPDITTSGHQLLQHLDQAQSLEDLEEQLQWLAQRVGATRLKLLGETVLDANAALKQVQTSAAQNVPYLGADPHAAFRRELAMCPAQQRLDAYRNAQQKIKRRLMRLRAQKEDKPAKTMPSPQKLRAHQQQRLRVLSQIYRAFVCCMRRFHPDAQRANHSR